MGTPREMTPAPTFCLIAGEPSGDRLGAALMAGLKEALNGQVNFIGIGGPQMADQGLQSLFPMEELSVMGIVEVLPKLVGLLARVRQSSDLILNSAPTALITIDSPDFCLRVAKKVKAARPDFPIIHYVAPSVWAWRPKRAVKMARYVDHVLALLPFEPPYMQEAGISCDFIGHPIATENVASKAEIAAFRREIGVTDGQKLLTLLPGSRASEIARLGPMFREVAQMLRKDMPELAIAIPAVGARVADLQQIFTGMDVSILDPRGLSTDIAEKQKRACYGASMAALAASGTVSLELAAAGTPMVIAYKVHWLTAYLIRRTIKITTATLVNLVSETNVVPEFLQENCRAELIYPEIKTLLMSKSHADAQIVASRDVMVQLGRGGDASGARAAKSVLNFLKA
ncbi:MAG: lipid-A-disaccharide synthase [Paracoccaceae bacterium]